MVDETPDPDGDLEEALAALGLRGRHLRRWLEDRRQICHRHGGERYYADVLVLVESCLARLEERSRRC